MRWYVVANRTEAIVYQGSNNEKFTFVERLSNPQGRFTDTELGEDRSGRVLSSAGMESIRHGLEQGHSQHERLARLFARRIAEELKAAHAQARFQELVLVAEPHFLGLIHAFLDLAIRKCVLFELGKELRQGSDQEIQDHIRTAMSADKS